MSNFYKSEDCPSSGELLDYQTGDMPLEEGKLIREHLAHCEFCSAEVEFYEHYPQTEETIEPEEIPAPLHDLARSLLASRSHRITSLDSLLEASEEF